VAATICPIGAQQTSLGVPSTQTAAPFRHQVDRRVTYVCPATGIPQNTAVWGANNEYTVDSAVCVAAVHAEILPLEQAGVVTFVMGPGAATFGSSRRNGIQSESYGPYDSSFSFDRSGDPAPIDGITTWRVPAGFTTPVRVVCPRLGTFRHQLWGIDIYADESSICAAAVHAGVIPNTGGPVTVAPGGARPSFQGSTRNGVTSLPYTAWPVSFTVSAGNATPSEVRPTLTEAAPTSTLRPAAPTPVPAPAATPSVAPPRGASTPVGPGFTVTVTMGSNGPVVTWPPVPQATGYAATRTKSDDLNCCNSSYGFRTFTATSPWQDQRLPMTGTYEYRVIANTPNGQMVATALFDFTAPPAGPGSLGRAPAGGGTRPAAAPSSTLFEAYNTTPAATSLRFYAVVGAVGYRVRRAIAGSGSWTILEPDPRPQPDFPQPTSNSDVLLHMHDVFFDSRQTYTYELHTLQGDGTYGTNTVTVVPGQPTDPTGFTATPTGPGLVKLEWTVAPGVSQYLISGPGTGPAGSVSTTGGIAGSVGQYTLSGVPAGRQTWTIASAYDPGGVLTLARLWPRATADVLGAEPVPRYRMLALGFSVDQQSTDVNDARDGKGDEVYFTAIINRTTLSGATSPVVKDANISFFVTGSYGDDAVSVPYGGRIRAGTASSTGGLRSGDVVPASLDLQGPTPPLQPAQFPQLLWEGDLENEAAVIIHPALWEDDLDARVRSNWTVLITNEARGLYERQSDARSESFYVIDERTYQTRQQILDYAGMEPVGFGVPHIYRQGSGGSNLFQCTTILGVWVRRPCEAHHVDRPIGLVGLGGNHPGYWFDPVIVLTKAGVNNRNTPTPVPGTFSMTLHDDLDTPTEATAKYTLHFRLERVP
jgi:hypothetical protein